MKSYLETLWEYQPKTRMICAKDKYPESGFYEFRKEFELAEKAEATVKIFAGTRYLLRINDEYICEGPCRGSMDKNYYDTVDVHCLKKGKNEIRVEIMYIRETMRFASAAKSDAPSLMFLMEGEGVEICSDDTWKCYQKTSRRLEVETCFLFPPYEIERFPATYVERSIEQTEYGDFDKEVHRYGVCPSRHMEPRPIPMIYPQSPIALLPQKITDGAVEYDFGTYVTAKVSVTLAPHTAAKIIYAECRETENGKGIRDDENGWIKGKYDLVSTEQENGRFTTFWFRAFRYLRIEVDDPSKILAVSARRCCYPLEISAEFECSDPLYHKMFEVSINTLLCCMHEIYVDCPYYEQQQYIMDSAIEAAVTAVLSGDRRMIGKCISEFAASQNIDGLLCGNYPSDYTQIITGFSFFFVFLLRNYLDLSGDAAFVKRYLPTVDKIFCYFDTNLSDGLIKASDKWDFVDWVPQWWSGVPANSGDETLTIYNMYYLAALKDAQYLCEKAGRNGLAHEYGDKYLTLKNALDRKMLDVEHDLYKDSESGEAFSMHCVIWSVLSGLCEGDRAKEKLKLLKQKELLQSSFSMNFYLFKALEAADARELYREYMSGWETMLALHCTTWCEKPADNPRSECHGWSSAPVYVFGRFILGVREEFDGITIAPVTAGLRYARGKVATRFGTVSVDWTMGDGAFRISVDASECEHGLEKTVVLPSGERVAFAEGKKELVCEWSSDLGE